MIGCLRTCVRKQPIIALYFEFETVVKFNNLEARFKKCISYGITVILLPAHPASFAHKFLC